MEKANLQTKLKKQSSLPIFLDQLCCECMAYARVFLSSLSDMFPFRLAAIGVYTSSVLNSITYMNIQLLMREDGIELAMLNFVNCYHELARIQYFTTAGKLLYAYIFRACQIHRESKPWKRYERVKTTNDKKYEFTTGAEAILTRGTTSAAINSCQCSLQQQIISPTETIKYCPCGVLLTKNIIDENIMFVCMALVRTNLEQFSGCVSIVLPQMLTQPHQQNTWNSEEQSSSLQ